MDSLIELIHELMPVLYIIAMLAICLKAILVFRYRGFDIVALIISFFRLYSPTEREMATKRKRASFMLFNNYINYYLYFLLLLFIVMLLIFQKKIFTYQ